MVSSVKVLLCVAIKVISCAAIADTVRLIDGLHGKAIH
jgi:hypothetical protein